MKRVKLVVVEGKETGKEFGLERKRVRIGRSKLNEVVITDPYVSEFHAQVTIRGDRFIIASLGTHQGVEVNGESMREKALVDGDKVRIGSCLLEFREEAAASPPRREKVPKPEPEPELALSYRKPFWADLGKPFMALILFLAVIFVLLLSYGIYWLRQLIR